MFEYEFLRPLNDLFPSGEVSQHWPSAMHDHMSTSFNISLHSNWRTAVQALCFIFTKRFYCLQNHCKYIFVFTVSLGWAGDWSLQRYRVQWRAYIGFCCCNTFRWSLEVICDPFALCTIVLNALSLMRSQQRLCVPVHVLIVFYDGVDRLQSGSFSTGDWCSVK